MFFFLLQDQAQLSQVVNFLCKLESPCDGEETKEENKDTEVEETPQTEKEEEIEEVLVNVSELDVESFQHLVVSARSVAITRPSNLAKYTILPEQKTTDGKLRNRLVTTVLAPFFYSYFCDYFYCKMLPFFIIMMHALSETCLLLTPCSPLTSLTNSTQFIVFSSRMTRKTIFLMEGFERVHIAPRHFPALYSFTNVHKKFNKSYF